MSWLRLDPESLAQRTHAAGLHAPSLAASLVCGMVGFTVVSVAGFAPWALMGRWFYRRVGELGLYAVCAGVFIALSGPLLHRLIMGPRSLGRFYVLFSAAFTAYSVAWTAGWMAWGGFTGSLVGLLAGALAMGTLLAGAFGQWNRWWQTAGLLFVHNAAGYFLGEAVTGALMSWQRTVAMLSWGGAFGLGMGAGLGAAFYLCQSGARARITELGKS